MYARLKIPRHTTFVSASEKIATHETYFIKKKFIAYEKIFLCDFVDNSSK